MKKVFKKRKKQKRRENVLRNSKTETEFRDKKEEMYQRIVKRKPREETGRGNTSNRVQRSWLTRRRKGMI